MHATVDRVKKGGKRCLLSRGHQFEIVWKREGDARTDGALAQDFAVVIICIYYID